MKLLSLKIFQRTTKSRMIFFIIGDTLLVSLAIYLAFLLRFEGKRKGSTLL